VTIAPPDLLAGFSLPTAAYRVDMTRGRVPALCKPPGELITLAAIYRSFIRPAYYRRRLDAGYALAYPS